jgi:two-component system, response regulator PdtaR
MPHSNQSPVSPSVLIVEDDGFLRGIAAEGFDAAGFIVFEAANAVEAISCLGINSARITTLFADIKMPGAMNGVFLAHHVRERWPWIRLAITSGEAHPSAAAMPQGTRFFPKPYELGRIVDFLDKPMAAA